MHVYANWKDFPKHGQQEQKCVKVNQLECMKKKKAPKNGAKTPAISGCLPEWNVKQKGFKPIYQTYNQCLSGMTNLSGNNYNAVHEYNTR